MQHVFFDNMRYYVGMDTSALRPFLDTTLTTTNFEGIGTKFEGKVRDIYTQAEQGRRFLITTDRQSAFDVNFTSIPLKGQVLNQISNWWFEKIEDIMPIQTIENPDPNVAVVKDLDILPIEIVVRAYLTGSSKTAIWVNYNAGARQYCGHTLPDGMVKNQPLDRIIVTPTTKGADSDDLISGEGIVAKGLATPELWKEMHDKALEVFARGQALAAKQGLILVDTKYEMGLDRDGVLTMADEVHTPDSSRYWIEESYGARFAGGEAPDSLDKEFFRLWRRERGFEYGDESTWPEITDDVRLMLATKYIDLYERITGETFVVPEDSDVAGRIERSLEPFRMG